MPAQGTRRSRTSSPRVTVTLEPIDEAGIEDLLSTAMSDAEPAEVMPPVDGPPGWNPVSVRAFREFYAGLAGGLDGPARTAAYVVRSDGAVAGMIRMSRRDGEGVVEAGMWLGRSYRGRGIGSAALRALQTQARAAGAHTIVAETTPTNAAAMAVLRRAGARLRTEPDAVHALISLPADA